MKRLFLPLIGLLTLATSCVGPGPLKGGKAVTVSKPARGVEQSVVQSDNPAAMSRQDQETLRTRNYTVPAGSRIEESRVTASEAGVPMTNFQAVVVSSPMPVVEREETRAKTELGAAEGHRPGDRCETRQFERHRLGWRGTVHLRPGLFVLSASEAAHRQRHDQFGRRSGRIALMVLPTLIVGNELLILAGVSAAVGIWFLAHRHGRLRGVVESAKH